MLKCRTPPMKFEDKMQISRPNTDEKKTPLRFQLSRKFIQTVKNIKGRNTGGQKREGKDPFFPPPNQLMPTFSNLPIYTRIKSLTEHILHRYSLGKKILTFSAIHLKFAISTTKNYLFYPAL